MRFASPRALAWLPLMGSLAQAANGIVYVTDLDIFTMLAPCAQSAISYNVMAMTDDSCPEAVTDLQACVCTKGISASLSTAISTDVSYSCGSTASSDQASAATVLSAYCNQATTVTFPSPTIEVRQYITDIPEIGYLAPCASSAVAYAVMSMTYDLCPSDAADLATCACMKNQNSLMLSQTINVAASANCAAQKADITSAQAFFSAYCNLNAGTSSFPSATFPPGDMTYYITDMPQYSAMPKCVKEAISEAVFTNTYDLCPNGPQFLASCACLKGSVSSLVSGYITTNINWDCSNTNAIDVSSAVGIFGAYCSAARNELVVTGVTASVSQTMPFGVGGTLSTAKGTKATGTTGKSGGGSTAGSGGSSGSSGNGTTTDGGTTTKSHTGVIAGVAVGVVVGVGALAVGAFFVFRHVRNKKNRPAPTDFQPLNNLTSPDNFNGKSELAGTPLSAPSTAGGTHLPADAGVKPPLPPPSPSLSISKYSAVSPQSPLGGATVSPLSANPNHQGAGGYNFAFPPPANVAELQSPAYTPNGAYLPQQQQQQQQQQHYSELQGQQAFRPPQRAELYGGQPPYGQPPQPIYQADSRPVGPPSRPAGGGMSFHSGPVSQSYAELDGSHNGYHGQAT